MKIRVCVRRRVRTVSLEMPMLIFFLHWELNRVYEMDFEN
jgi:hypothetical protein